MAEKRNSKRKLKMDNSPKTEPQKRSFFNKLKHPSQFSTPQLMIFILVFGVIGYFIYQSFAASPLVATLQAEQMKLPSGASIFSDSTASGGKGVYMGKAGTATGSVNFPSSVTSMTVIARGHDCSSQPWLEISLDGTRVYGGHVTSTSWNSYSVSFPKAYNTGTHSLALDYTNDYNSKSCNGYMDLDVSNFYGQAAPAPAPTLALSASPSSVNTGQASTLTWTSTNASSCTASGAWSGSESTSGSTSTGALNQNSTYILNCSGSGGTATASATVMVNASSSGLTFESVTDWARPSPATPSAASSAGWRLVPFTTQAGLNSAITNMQGHDYIYYNGTGVLTISSSTSAVAFSIHDKNPSSPVVIDFGTAASIWNPAIVSGNYVKFAYNGTSNQDAIWLYGDSNLRIYGGYMTAPVGGDGVLMQPSETNPIHDILWYDGYVYDTGNSGIAVRGSTPSTGSASNAYNLDLRFEVNRFAMNPAWDNHADKGTGMHALILHGSQGGIYDSRFAIYGHDALKPGEMSAGKTWPEGAGGSVIEQGNDAAADYNNDVMYALGKNNLMIPNGTNPGSTGKQTGGNVFNLWGNIKLNGNVIGWAEGDNISGSVIHSDSGTWFPGSPALVVQHGRHTNTNQSTVGSNISQPYPTTDPAGTSLGIIYQDIQ